MSLDGKGPKKVGDGDELVWQRGIDNATSVQLP